MHILKKDLDFVTVIQEVRPSNPDCVKYLNHSFFKDYSSVTYSTSIGPGNKAGYPQVLDLVALKYNPNDSVQYKAAFDEEWAKLPQRGRAVTVSVTPSEGEGCYSVCNSLRGGGLLQCL